MGQLGGLQVVYCSKRAGKQLSDCVNEGCHSACEVHTKGKLGKDIKAEKS